MVKEMKNMVIPIEEKDSPAERITERSESACITITVKWPGEGMDANPNIKEALASAGKSESPVVLEFEQDKVYHTWPETSYYNTNIYISNSQTVKENRRGERWSTLYMHGMDNVTIEGNNAMLMVHGLMTPIIIDKCENILIKNLRIDFARPTVSEYTVIEKTDTYVKVKVHADSLYELKDENGDGSFDNILWLGELTLDSHVDAKKRYWTQYARINQEYDSINGTNWRIENWTFLGYGDNIIDLGENVLQFNNASSRYKQGCTYSLRDASRDQVGVFIHKSKNVYFEDCKMHFLHGLGIVGQRSENLTFTRMECTPRKESGRVIACDNDFMQMSGCRGDLIVQDSHFSGAHDDPCNVHGTHLRIMEVNEAEQTIKVKFMESRSWGFEVFEAGDEVEFISAATLKPYQRNRVISTEVLDEWNVKLTLKEPLPDGIQVDSDVVENITWTPNVYYRNNLAEYFPTRGILCTTRGKVVIEGNTWKGCMRAGVLVEDDASGWYESGYVQDMTIRNNTFYNCRAPQVNVNPRTSAPDDPYQTVHSNITVEGNVFIAGPVEAAVELSAISTKNFMVENNTFPKAGGRISLDGCNEVVIQNNINQAGVKAGNSINVRMKPILNRLFTSHMVLQANKPIRFFGEGEGEVMVSFNGSSATAVCAEGKWLAELEPMPYGGPYTAIIILDGERVELSDIYLGDVYLLAGQSNMQFKLYESTTPESEWKDVERMRLFSTARLEPITPDEHFTPSDGWVVCNKKNAGYWSAIGYLTGEILEREKDVPIGLITCYQGASVIESWVPEGLFEKNGICIPLEEKAPNHAIEYFKIWNQDGKLYHFTAEQLFPYALAGVLWYQGEADTCLPEAGIYDRELALLIDCWREGFRDPDLLFVVIQIAGNDHHRDPEGWCALQKSQWNVQHLRENVKTIISEDVCERDHIHPPTKDVLSRRIAQYLK